MRPVDLAMGGIVIGLLAGPAHAQVLRTKPREKSWDVTIGAGPIHAPDFPGSSTRRVFPFPFFEVYYKDRFSFNGASLSWFAVNTESAALSFDLSYDFGRQDSDRAASFSPGATRLRGLGTIEGTPELGLTASATVGGLPVYGSLRKAPDGQGHGGAIAHLGIDFPVEIDPKLTAAFSLGVDWVDENYAQAYFGVTRAQASRTRFREYDAKGGFNNGSANLSVVYNHDRHWRAVAFAGIGRLLGDAADSPITERRNQPTFGFFVTYRF